MPDLLFELFSEEIPARMQARAAEDLRRMVTDRLVDAGVESNEMRDYLYRDRTHLAVYAKASRPPGRRGPWCGPAGSVRGTPAPRRC